MLPRKKYLRVLCLSLAITFGASSLVSSPAHAITNYTPPVTVTELDISPSTAVSLLTIGERTTILLPAQIVKQFTLVGLTWVGPVSAGTEFQVRVRESGSWSAWFELEYGEYQGEDGSENAAARVGSDPLLTGLADGVEVVMANVTGIAPSQMKVTLVNSTVTQQDQNIAQSISAQSYSALSQSIGMATTQESTLSQVTAALTGAAVSPQGALVLRPRIVSRAEWGANETWRDPVPKMGTTLLAGIVHHTASTNNYTADQGPAQMRNLYAYFTQSLNYADMGYNFLVDKYGTIYEGRSGCTYGDVNCDSTAMPTQGAHTAGLNINTFGVSAIGNYDVLAPQNPAVMVESIASLMAWKLAPYGLAPNAPAYILSTDTSGSSKYSAGQTAVTQVISAHRDVGKTVCPGRYLYPYMGEVRARATQLLAPIIQGVSVTPAVLDYSATIPVSVSAIIPADATWSVTVKNADSGVPIHTASGTQVTSGTISYTWDRKDTTGAMVPMGRYSVTLNASIGKVTLPSATNVISIASMPQAVSQVAFIRTSRTKTKVSWTSDVANFSPISANYYRTSVNNGATWTAWKSTTGSRFSATWKLSNTYAVELKSANALGESQIVRSTYKVKKFSPPKPAAVTAVNFKQLAKNRMRVSWVPAATEYASSGYYYRMSKDGGKWSKWTKSAGLKTSVTVSNWKQDSTYKIQVKVRNLTGYSPRVTTLYPASWSH